LCDQAATISYHISRIALAQCLALLISRQRGAVKAALHHAGQLESVGKTPEWIATWIMSGVLNKTISVSFSFSRHSRTASLPKIERQAKDDFHHIQACFQGNYLHTQPSSLQK
jgi:hypothetical protein